MEKLTDIKHPWKHQQMSQRPPRESIFKRFIKWCWSVITAPFRLIWSLIRAIWNLITRLFAGITTAIFALFTKSKSGGLTIGRTIKNLLLSLWPRSQAGWIIFLLVLVFLWQVLTSLEFPLIDSNKWQAVTLSNNQIYFGRLQEVSKEYATLKDVYYLQAPSGSQTTTNLVQLNEKIYGPENQMYIPKQQIIFWENLGENSQVVKAIEQTR